MPSATCGLAHAREASKPICVGDEFWPARRQAGAAMSQQRTCVWFCSADVGLAQALARVLGSPFELRHSEEFRVGDAHGQEGWCDVAMLDLRPAGKGPGLDAQLSWVDEINRADLPPPVIALLGEGDSGLKAMERGVYDTLSTPPNIAELRLILQRAHEFYRAQKKLHRLRSQEPSLQGLYDLVGSSEPMQAVFSLA